MKIAIVQVLLLSKICLGELTNTVVESIDEIQDESLQTTQEDPSLIRFESISSMLSGLNFLINKMIASNQQPQEYMDSNQLHSLSNQQASPCSKNTNSAIQSNLRGSYFIVSRSPVVPNYKQHGKQNVQLEGFYDSSSDSSVSTSSSDSSSGTAAYGEYGEYGYYSGDYGYYYDYGSSSESSSSSSSTEDGSEGEDVTSSSVSVESDTDVVDNGEEEVTTSANEVDAIAPLSAPRHNIQAAPRGQQQAHRDFAPAVSQSRLRKVQAPQRFVAQKVQQLKPNHILLRTDKVDKEQEVLERNLDVPVQLKNEKKKEAKHVAAKEEKSAAVIEKQVKSEVKAAKIAATHSGAKKTSKTFQEDVHDE